MKEFPDKYRIQHQLDEARRICDGIHHIGGDEEFQNTFSTSYSQGRLALIQEALERNSGLSLDQWMVKVINNKCEIFFKKDLAETKIREVLQIVDFYIQMAEIESTTNSTREKLKTRRLTRPDFIE